RQLSGIAPTIPVMKADAVGDRWQDMVTTAGRIFGDEEEAADAVSEVEDGIARFAAEHPEAQGKTFSFGQLTPQQQFGLVTSASDPSAELLSQLGLRLDPAVTGRSDTGDRVVVAPENIGLLGSDLLVMWPLAGGPE